MTTESFLTFWHEHINSIIGILVTLVLILLVIYLLIEFFKEKQGPPAKTTTSATSETAAVAAPVDFSHIEESLKKLIENSNLAAAASAAAKPPTTGVDPAEIEALKKALAEKDDLIKKMKDSIVEGKSDGKGEALQEKVRDLEARLTEYEIIEDDIADLSMYKEENARLKSELEVIKAGGTPTAAAPAPPPAKVEAKMEVAPPSPPPPPAKPAAAPVPTPPPTAAPTQEVAAALLEAATAPATPAIPVAAPKLVPKEAPADVQFEEPDPELADDIMAEFAAAVKEQRVADSVKPVQKAEVIAPPPGAGPAGAEDAAKKDGWDEGGINTDKMLGEIDDLNASSDDGTSALEVTEVDTDKMLLETNALNTKETV